MTAVKVKLSARNKARRKVKHGARTVVKQSSIQVKPGSQLNSAREDWKILKTFVGIKFNDKEKQRLWPFVALMFIDPQGIRKARRPNLGSFIKEALWKAISLQQEARKGVDFR